MLCFYFHPGPRNYVKLCDDNGTPWKSQGHKSKTYGNSTIGWDNRNRPTWFHGLNHQLRMCQTLMVGKLQNGILNHCKNLAFFNYFHSKVFFVILAHAMHVCLLFEKISYHNQMPMQIFKSHHCFLFLNKRAYISYSTCWFRKY